MRFGDLLAMSVGNLRRRKLRTFLTVLGVIIGTASVVIMVSLGIGLNDLMIEEYSSYGDMTSINVYSNTYYIGDSDEDVEYITDETLEQFREMEHVTGVSPTLNVEMVLKQGAYYCYTSVSGVTKEYLATLPLSDEQKAGLDDGELKFYYGNQVATWFNNEKTGEGYWDNNETPPVDLEGKPMFVVFDTDAYWASRYPSSETPVKAPKKYMINSGGMIGSGEEYDNYSYDIFADVDLLEEQLKMVFKKNPIPGQPTNSKGKPYPYFIYDRLLVFVDDMENVTTVQQQLTDMGYQTSSQMQWIEQAQQTFGLVQLVLGGIGAVSLFVAAIGIANTMMMAIYERTKEIGIIKVLGCDMRNIRNMFLLESGFIGFMGGTAGLVISYGVGFIMNRYLGIGQAVMGVEGDISRIPPWLAVGAVFFAILVGMLAGFFPSLRAMHLSPLAAIRSE